MAVVPSDGTTGAVPAGNEPQPQAAQAPMATPAEDLVPQPKDIFMLARQSNFAVAMKLLDAYPQHWTATDDEGHSLLHWGALVGSKDFCQRAIDSGVPVDSVAQNKQTPLMWAVLRSHMSVTKVLLDAKASLTVKDSLGATPLMIAIQHRSYQSMLLIMNRCGKQQGGHAPVLKDSDKNGCTAAHWASYKGDITALKLLDYFGADLSATDNTEMTPLHRAVSATQPPVIEFLLEKRADPQQPNGEGKTIMDIAEGQGSSGHMVKLLKNLLKKHSTPAGEQTGDDDDTNDLEMGGGDKKGKKPKEGFMKMIMKAGEDKTAQKAFPVFWLVCVSMATFEYLMDLRTTSYQVAPTASLLFEVGVPLSLTLFFWVALMDPGKLPARTKGASGVEELMRALDTDGPTNSIPDISRLCTTTWVLKDLRTKYCAQTGACVDEFDHWCVWLNTSIGKRNHRQFLCLALVEWLTQAFHLYLLICMARALVPYQSIGQFLFGVLAGYPLLTLVFVVQLLTCPFVMMLIFYQSRLVAQNLTTNEMMNASRYEHFWVTSTTMPGRMQKMFRNPFNKGSVVMNCFDFWWFRQRSRQVPQASGSCCSKHGCSKGHH